MRAFKLSSAARSACCCASNSLLVCAIALFDPAIKRAITQIVRAVFCIAPYFLNDPQLPITPSTAPMTTNAHPISTDGRTAKSGTRTVHQDAT